MFGSFNTTPKVLKNTTTTIAVTATDVDSSKLTFGLANGAPRWASIDRNTGILTLSPGLDDSSATFNVTVSDGSAPVSQAVSVPVYSAGVQGSNLYIYGTSGNDKVKTPTARPS